MVFFSAAEDDVAALDIGLRVFQFQPDAERLERVHLDQVVAADVHAAEHADDDWHSGEYRPPLKSKPHHAKPLRFDQKTKQCHFP